MRAEDICYATGFEVPPPIDAGAAFAYGPRSPSSRATERPCCSRRGLRGASEEMSLADETVLVDGFGHFEPVDGPRGS